jgi:PAS domain S-box-containing protein
VSQKTMDPRDVMSTNIPSSFLQHWLEALDRLDSQSAALCPRRFYLYDVIQQHTLCASASIGQMLNYTAAEIHAMGPNGLAALIHPDDLNQVSAHYQRFNTLCEGEIITIKYRMKRSDGSWRRLRSQETILMQTGEGIPHLIFGMLQDITDLPQFIARNHAQSTTRFCSIHRALKRRQKAPQTRRHFRASSTAGRFPRDLSVVSNCQDPH